MHLAIDTSTNTASLALFKNGDVAKAESWSCEQNHTVELLPKLDEMLGSLDAGVKDITSISAAIGPGSFNGVRVGLSTAKGLALGLNVPVAGVDTLKATAFSFKNTPLQICPVLNAGRGDIACAIYKYEAGELKTIKESGALKVSELSEIIIEKTLFCGEYLPKVKDEITKALGERAIFPKEKAQNRAIAIGLLGINEIEKGKNADIATLQPIYLRKPSITKPKKVVKLNLEPKAVIWDMDGIIVNSAEAHLGAWKEVFAKRGITFTKEEFEKTFGQRNDVIIKGKLGDDAPEELIKEITIDKEQTFRELLLKGGVKTFPGVLELMEGLKNAGFKMAIASSAPIENIELIMRNLGLEGFIDAIVSEQDVTHSKPDPEAFLKASEKLGVKPSWCTVIEDAVFGVKAAAAANMSSIAVTNTHPSVKLLEADITVDSLKEIKIAEIETIIKWQERKK